MNLELTPAMDFPAMLDTLQASFPLYKIEPKKNPIAKFEYIQVYKSAYVGVWIRPRIIRRTHRYTDRLFGAE